MSIFKINRRTYYNLFAHVYDAFIKLHSRRDEGSTREYLVEKTPLEEISVPAVLDVCCGTGAVTSAFAERYSEALIVGLDFSRGMLLKARTKPTGQRVRYTEGDAARLPFRDESFDVVTCSHALYELKGPARQRALSEMKRVVRPGGVVLIMEHEVPERPFKKALFNLRMLAMGSADAREFVSGGLEPYTRVFPDVALDHTPSGKSKLMICRK